MADPRLIVIGAGPAGVRAAETLVDAGLRPIVIDEGARDGGQTTAASRKVLPDRNLHFTAAKPHARKHRT